MKREKDPMGTAIAEYYSKGVAGRLRVFSPDFDEDEIPVEVLFRTFSEMPALEQKALQMAEGRVLDVGAGAGCHSLALQEMGKDVVAIDISPLSVETMRKRGVGKALEKDFWEVDEKFDTILMLMNGIGIVGRMEALPRFFKHIGDILNDGGQLLLDSSDISYLFENEDGIIELPEYADNGETDCPTPYYGELQYQMQYKRTKGEPFNWLYIDFDTLAALAGESGFCAELVAKGEHYEYLAILKKK